MISKFCNLSREHIFERIQHFFAAPVVFIILLIFFNVYLGRDVVLNPELSITLKVLLVSSLVLLVYYIPFKLFYILLFIIPVFYFFGTVLPDKMARTYELSIIFLPALVSVIVFLKHRKWQNVAPAIKYLLPLFLYIVFFISSTLVNDSNLYRSIQSFQFELRYFPIFLVLSMVVIKQERLLTILKIFFIALCIYLISGYYHLIFGRFLPLYGDFFLNEINARGSLFGSFPLPLGRFFTPLGGHNMGGMFLVIGFLVFYTLWKTDPQIFRKVTGLKSIRVWQWLMIIGIILTLSKMSFLSLMVGVWLVNFSLPHRKGKMLSLAIFGILLILLFSSITLFIEIESDRLHDLPAFVKQVFPYYHFDLIQRGHNRPATYYFLFRILSRDLKTFLFGLGPGNFGLALGAYGVDVRESSLFFEQLKQQVGYNYLPGIGTLLDSNVVSLSGQIGLVGMFFFFLIFLPIWLRAKRAYFHVNEPLGKSFALMTMVVIPVFLLSGFSNTFWTVKPNALWFWVLCGIGMAQINIIYGKEKSQNTSGIS
ncbi:hypothetical protein ES707_21446 [subsurface metagenome]